MERGLPDAFGRGVKKESASPASRSGARHALAQFAAHCTLALPMCGRYRLTQAERFAVSQVCLAWNSKSPYDIAPFQDVPVILDEARYID